MMSFKKLEKVFIFLLFKSSAFGITNMITTDLTACQCHYLQDRRGSVRDKAECLSILGISLEFNTFN